MQEVIQAVQAFDASTFAIIAVIAGLAFVLTKSGKSKGSRCEGDMLAQVNAIRSQGYTCNGVYYPPCGPVQIDPTLQHVAATFANELAANRIPAGHIGADGSTFTQRLARVGYRYQWAGENTAHNTPGAAATIQAFADSPEHCPILMKADASVCGLACSSDGKTAYWVQVMAKP